MVLQSARWVVVLLTTLGVLSAAAFAALPRAGGNTCTESCAAHCPCCISKSSPSSSPDPLAPNPPRISLDKNFQPAPVLALLVPSACENALGRTPFTSRILSRSRPLYQQHCAYLI